MPLARADLSVRPARNDDLPGLRCLMETSKRAHLTLDWWTLDDWVSNPAFLVAQSDQRAVGFGIGVRDASPVAWLRALVAEDGLSIGVLLDALLPPMLDALRTQGGPTLACLAWPEWLAEQLPHYGFESMARVVTLCKDDESAPGRNLVTGALVRKAQPGDLEAIVTLDHAAFDVEWWYGPTTFHRMLNTPAHFIVAEQNGALAGYAYGDAPGLQAHISRLAVHPAHQRRGLGAELLGDLIAHFLAQDVTRITVNTQTDNEASLRLYRRWGFAPRGEPVTVWQISLGDPHGRPHATI